MVRMSFVAVTAVLIGGALVAQAQQPAPAQAPASAPVAAPPPPTATTKVTDNVYIFRYVGHQSMFIVTPAGVIATDPISERRPTKPYIDAIQAVTKAPIKYVIYSHSHFDHTAGGQPFKDLGAIFIAHRRAKERLLELKKQNALLPDIVMPDQVVDNKRTIKLGDTTLELIYVGRNHSDNSLVMRLPKEKLVFVVDFAPIESVQFRNIPDNASPLEYIESLKKLDALDWDRMIPGHPYAGGRLGTKKDVEDDIAYMEDLSAEVKKAADAGKCFDTAMKEVKLPKYEKWANYEASLPANVERFCYWWGRGY
jgi:glyoxylase-like metal-dependent hydrolase (beta-lactamase superfamily II)